MTDDLISRQVVKEQMIKYGFLAPDMTVTEFVEDLPPVNPQEPCGETVSLEAFKQVMWERDIAIAQLKELGYGFGQKIEPKTGHWSRRTKVDAYDIAGVKTWGIKCQCDRCDFTTIVVEDFGYYKYCPNCGARMVEPQESEDKE